MNDKRILLIGSVPPPFHGSNVMCENYIESFKRIKINYYFINKRFSKSLHDHRVIKLSKIIEAFKILFKLIIIKFNFAPTKALLFISSKSYPLVFDWLLIQTIKFLKIPYILRFGALGYSKTAKKNFVWNFIVKTSLNKAINGIVLNYNLIWDVINFLPREKLIEVPNTLEDVKYIKQFYKTDEIKILYLSNLLPDKGIMELLESIKIINNINKYNIIFYIVGDYISKDFYSRIIKESYDIRHIVCFESPKTGEDKFKLFQECDIFVLPTYYEQETFALANLEAMRAGLPVISTDFAAIPTIVINGKTGFIVQIKNIKELVDKLIILIKDSNLRKKMGQNGRKRFLEKYSSNIIDEKLANML